MQESCQMLKKNPPGKLLTDDGIMIVIEKGHSFMSKDRPSFNSPMFVSAQKQ